MDYNTSIDKGHIRLGAHPRRRSIPSRRSDGIPMKKHSKATAMAAFAFLGFQTLASAGILGSADRYAVLAGSTVTNTGLTVLSGDLGVWPGSAITGFPPGIVTNGSIHAGDPSAMQAQADLTVAYNLRRPYRHADARRAGRPERALRLPDRKLLHDLRPLGRPADRRRSWRQRLLAGRVIGDPRRRCGVHGTHPC